MLMLLWLCVYVCICLRARNCLFWSIFYHVCVHILYCVCAVCVLNCSNIHYIYCVLLACLPWVAQGGWYYISSHFHFLLQMRDTTTAAVQWHAWVKSVSHTVSVCVPHSLFYALIRTAQGAKGKWITICYHTKPVLFKHKRERDWQ